MMGSYLYVTHAQFAMAKEQEEPARQVLLQFTREYLEGAVSIRGRGILDHLGERKIPLESLTLDELLSFFDWTLHRSSLFGTIDGIHFEADCASNEYEMFTFLSPFITQGSFIELEYQQHGNHYIYRYAFTGTRMVEQEPHYDPVPNEREKGAPV